MCFATFYHPLLASKLYDLVALHLLKCLTHSCPCQTGTEVLMCRAKWLSFYLLLTTFYLLLITYNIALSTLISTPTENIRLKIMHEFHDFDAWVQNWNICHCESSSLILIVFLSRATSMFQLYGKVWQMVDFLKVKTDTQEVVKSA